MLNYPVFLSIKGRMLFKSRLAHESCIRFRRMSDFLNHPTFKHTNDNNENNNKYNSNNNNDNNKEADEEEMLKGMNLFKASEILSSPPVRKKRLGLDFHLWQAFTACFPPLIIYLIAMYGRSEMNRMEKELEEETRLQIEEERKIEEERITMVLEKSLRKERGKDEFEPDDRNVKKETRKEKEREKEKQRGREQEEKRKGEMKEREKNDLEQTLLELHTLKMKITEIEKKMEGVRMGKDGTVMEGDKGEGREKGRKEGKGKNEE